MPDPTPEEQALPIEVIFDRLKRDVFSPPTQEDAIRADLTAISQWINAAESKRAELEREVERLADNNRHTHANLDFCIEQREALAREVEELKRDFAIKDRALTDYFADASKRADDAEREVEELRARVGEAELQADNEGEAAERAEARVERLEEALRSCEHYATDARDSLDEDEMDDGEPSLTAARLMAIEMVSRAARSEPTSEKAAAASSGEAEQPTSGKVS